MEKQGDGVVRDGRGREWMSRRWLRRRPKLAEKVECRPLKVERRSCPQLGIGRHGASRAESLLPKVASQACRPSQTSGRKREIEREGEKAMACHPPHYDLSTLPGPTSLFTLTALWKKEREKRWRGWRTLPREREGERGNQTSPGSPELLLAMESQPMVAVVPHC